MGEIFDGPDVAPTPSPDLRDKAIAMRAESGVPYAVVTDASADPVRVAIATPTESLVIKIDRSEYDGMKVLRVLGIDTRDQVDAREWARIVGERRQVERRDGAAPAMPGRIERRHDGRRQDDKA